MALTSDTPVFRASGVDDPAARALLDEYFETRRAGFPGGPAAYRRADPAPSDFENPRGVFLVIAGTDASGDPADVGCGGVRLIDHGAGVSRFEIKHLWVQPHARGQGLGRRLLEELEWRARAFGGSEVVLDTNGTQREAAALYRSSGYQEIRPYNDNPNATHWFAKNLTTELE